MPRRRVVPIVVSSLLGLLVLIGGALLWFSRPEHLTPILLSALAEQTGLRIEAQGPARIIYRPMPRLRLRGMQGRVDGSADPLFVIGEIDLALPWRSLFADEAIEIESLHLSRLQLNLPAARAWWDARPPTANESQWPRLLRGLDLEDSDIHGSGWTLQIVSLNIPRFALDDRFELRLMAELQTGSDAGAEARVWPLNVVLLATPTRRDATLRLQIERIALAASDELPGLDAHGDAQFGNATVLDLEGRLDAIPANWPAPPGFDHAQPLPFALTVHGADDAPLDLTIALTQGENRIRLRGDPERMRAALFAAQGSPLPAIVGDWQATSIQIDGVHVQGLELHVEPDAQP